MATLPYISLFCRDVPALCDFYQGLFDFEEIERDRSPYFRSLDTGTCAIGFSTRDAQALLDLEDTVDGERGRAYLTFQVDDPGTVDRMTREAGARGARLVKAPFETYYGAYLSVLHDPDGNVFRISAPRVVG